MSDPVLDLDQQLRAPLAAFHGAPPPAPDWFKAAIAQAPERGFTEVEGAAIETLCWGPRGRPGLLFLHGGMANADWYDHMAPMFAGDWRVASMSLSGMGRSQWRARYDMGQLAREMSAVAYAAGLYDAGKPVFVAHSFGSRPLMRVAADPVLAPRAAVVLDSAISSPETPESAGPPTRPNKIYPTLEAALARFRLMPYQLCDNLYILDHIARHSVVEVGGKVGGEDGGPGWRWRFDPEFFAKLQGGGRDNADADLRGVVCPMAFILGARSDIVRADNLAFTKSIAPAGTRFETVADAAHHLFLDQPQATAAALRDVLAGFGP